MFFFLSIILEHNNSSVSIEYATNELCQYRIYYGLGETFLHSADELKGERPSRVNRNRDNLVNGTNRHMCGCGCAE